MVQYYWPPSYQQMTPPQVAIPGGRPPGLPREESYIENIFRLNRGKPGNFHFSFDHKVDGGGNTINVRGVVEAAGRDHVILSDLRTNHRYLFPMIYFDFAEFDEELAYFDQSR